VDPEQSSVDRLGHLGNALLSTVVGLPFSAMYVGERLVAAPILALGWVNNKINETFGPNTVEAIAVAYPGVDPADALALAGKYLGSRLSYMSSRAAAYAEYSMRSRQATYFDEMSSSASRFVRGAPTEPVGLTFGTALSPNSLAGRIVATDSIMPGTLIPSSFELVTESGARFWVHPNATKDFAKFLRRSEVGGITHTDPVRNQAVLMDFLSVVNMAANRGINFTEMMYVGRWELRFSMRPVDRLPVIYHARPTR
jgi:hypothetical protein